MAKNNVVTNRHLQPIGKKIRKLRQAQGLTQRDLAAMANTPAHYIYDLETNYSGYALVRINNVAQALGISLDDIINLTDKSLPIKKTKKTEKQTVMLKYLTIRQLSIKLNVCEHTIRRYIKKGFFKTAKKSLRCNRYLIAKDDLFIKKLDEESGRTWI
jgi:transcriptional regulator with XRE-family HTH domain